MPPQVHYQFFHQEKLLGEGRIQVPFTAGRQSEIDQPGPVSVCEISDSNERRQHNADTPRKLVIVPLSDRTIPRLTVRVDVDASGNLVARNVHRVFEMELASRERIHANQQVVLGREGTIRFLDLYQLKLTLEPAGNAMIKPVSDYDDHRSYVALDFASSSMVFDSSRLLSMFNEDQPFERQGVAVELVRVALEAFKEPPGSEEFFAAAGRAAIKMIDLDRVAVLRKDGDNWVCRTQSFRPGMNEERVGARNFSQTLLRRMEAASKTMIVEPQLMASSMGVSMQEVDRAVAAPIFDDGHSITGALYGDRTLGGATGVRPIGELEAALLEVLATGISSSLAIQHEQRLRGSMSQFFSPVVLSQLMKDHKLLDSRETEVSVLFCDIRGFSSVTEKIGPTQAISWINDVLTTLSECVLDHDGVLVDYVGDELMAMWGAPGRQTDHAERACRAALDMLAQVGPIGHKWRGVVAERFGFGIGINSGSASVGNTGSKKKFKYGPLGNTVNLASRVQGATKQIGVPGLITGETAQAARGANFQTRRLATTRVVGIERPIELHQLCEGNQSRDLCDRYEQALLAYEQNDLQTATARLASLVQDYPTDRPTLILLTRTVDSLTQPDRAFDPIWNLTVK